MTIKIDVMAKMGKNNKKQQIYSKTKSKQNVVTKNREIKTKKLDSINTLKEENSQKWPKRAKIAKNQKKKTSEIKTRNKIKICQNGQKIQ